MTTRFELYKITLVTENISGVDTEIQKIYKMTTDSFESINLNLSSPVSPMPLPEEDATENILVKMEGNSQQIRFGFRFSPDLSVLQEASINISQSGVALKYNEDLVNVDQYNNNGTDTNITYTDLGTSSNSIEYLESFLKQFENKSITDTFIVRIDDGSPSPLMEYGGSLVGIDCTLDSGSPVVWSINLDFMVGNVISIYDADTPEQPNDFKITKTIPSGQNPVVTFMWKDPDSSGGTNITSYVLIARCLSKSKNQTVTLTSWSDSDADGWYDYYIQSGSFIANEQWEAYMYATNTGGRGNYTKRIKFTV